MTPQTSPPRGLDAADSTHKTIDARIVGTASFCGHAEGVAAIPTAREDMRANRQRLGDPRPGQWVRLQTSAGQDVVRFVRWVSDGKTARLYVDRGAYGSMRDDLYLRASSIERIEPVARPQVRLRVTDPFGIEHIVGRYVTQAAAEAAVVPPGCTRFIR